MLGNTHREFSVTFVLIGSMVLYNTPDREINYYLLLIIMLMSGKVGGRFPDFDHQWKYVREKCTWAWVVNKLIHLTGGKHRSRHTHSWDVLVLSWLGIRALITVAVVNGYISSIDKILACVLIDGFMLGWVSHLFSDSMTHDGTYPTFWSSHRHVTFVPKELKPSRVIAIGIIIIVCSFGVYVLEMRAGRLIIPASALYVLCIVGVMLIYIATTLGNVRFNTGMEWEKFVFKNVRRLNKALGVAAVTLPIFYKYDIVGKIKLFIQ